MIRAGLIDIVFRKTVSLKAEDLKDSAAVTLMVCVVGVIPISKTIGRAQTVWIERLQKRVAVTATMLGDMKAIKMLGLPEVLSGVILQLRRVELSGSEKFRKLLLWQVLRTSSPLSRMQLSPGPLKPTSF
ncbi:hypothetical protein N0V92_005349 [Colletotrichum tropicale]|nr:hypothetical protein N0V92_005349 [Colletotrichum tropicale]